MVMELVLMMASVGLGGMLGGALKGWVEGSRAARAALVQERLRRWTALMDTVGTAKTIKIGGA